MGQKVHPNGLRVGVIKDWNSRWYADDKNFSDYLVEDYKIRKFVTSKLFVSGISKIEIERTAKMVKINLYTAKPGIIIGKGGAGVEAIKADIADAIHFFEIGQKRDIDEYEQHVFKDIARRPLIMCSDNHNPKDYTVKEMLWIKADLTFAGLIPKNYRDCRSQGRTKE